MVEGDVIADRFEIRRVAGRGGMGTVFRARDRHTDEDVALKVLHATISEAEGDPTRAVVARFQREAEVLASLDEPSIVRYVAHGTTELGAPFLAMQWLDGEDLASRLERGPLAPAEAVAIAARAATALGALHARRIVHRDVKPANIFLPSADPSAAMLLDLGIAHVPKGDTRLTAVGMVMGTPEYMSPEQARGDLDVSARSDVFSLGAVLFECVAGHPPFTASHIVAVLAKILFEEAPRLASAAQLVHPALDALVSRMLEKDPLGRPVDGASALRELLAVRELAPPRWSQRPGPNAHAIGTNEQRIISVITATDRAARALATSDTLIADSVETPPSIELSKRMDILGGKLERLANGAYVVTVASSAGAIEQAARAATCALALRAALRGPHVAVATGRGVLGERLPVGDAIDRAVGMLSEIRSAPTDDPREPLPIAIDAVTATLVRSRFVVRGPADRKTLHGPLPRAIASRTILGRPSAWVGRDAELAALVAAYERVASARAPEAHVVVGASGIGKSRLGDELARRLATRTDARVICASGDPTRAGSPLEMLSQALRFAVGVGLADPRAERRAKLERRVGAVVAPEETARVVAFLAPLLSASDPTDENHPGVRAAREDPRFMSDETRRAVDDYLSAEATRAPVVIILDDLQWTDPATVAFLGGALAALERSPILLVVLARPEIDRAFPALLAPFPTTRMELAELPRGACEKLVRSALSSGAPGVVVDEIVERAGGNPFLLEELVRAAAEGARESLPQTVLAVVQSRLDALEPEARRALRAASLFGRLATAEGVAAVLDVEVERAGAHLDALVDADILARSFDGYGFRQATTRDAAYEMLTPQDRKLGHALVAEFLEQQDAIDPLSVGRHFDHGGDSSRALLWYRRAATSALEASDLDGAIQIAKRAEACGASGADLGALRAVMAEAALWLADYPAARAYAAEALDLLEPSTRPWLLALGNAVRIADKLGERAQVGAFLATLLKAQVVPATAPAFADVLAQAAVSLVLSGQAALADTLLSRADELARDLAYHPRVEGRLHVARAFRASVTGEPERYYEHMSDAARSFERGGDMRSACAAYGNSGHGAALLGAHEVAVEILESALTLAERNCYRNARGWILHNLGTALGRVGSIQRGIAMEREAAESGRAQHDNRLLVASLTALASLLATMNEYPAAKEAAAEAALAAEAGSPQMAIALATDSRVALAIGDSHRAVEAAARAVTILDRLAHIEEGEVEIWLRYAEALGAEGRRVEAQSALERAGRRLRELGATIKSLPLRESYFRRIPEHAALLDLERQGIG